MPHLSDAEIQNLKTQILQDTRFNEIIMNIIQEILQNRATVAIKPATAPTKRNQRGRHADWTKSSDSSLRMAHRYRKKHNLTIEAELSTELSARFPTYDTATQTFIGRKKKAKSKPQKVRIIKWAEKTDDILIQAYKHRSKQLNGIDDALNAELSKRFGDKYNPVTRQFTTPIPKSKKASKTRNTSSVSSPSTQPATAIPNTTKKQKPNKPATIKVLLRKVKMSLTATYYDVFINGKRVLHNHANTHLQLFGDGTVLGIHGIATDNAQLPQTPLWIVYGTDIEPTKWTGKDKFSGYQIYVKNVIQTAQDVRLETSDRCIKLLNIERLVKHANGTKFTIVEPQNTK